MLVKKGSVYGLSSFKNFKKLICGFSSKEFGDTKDKRSLVKFAKSLGIKEESIVITRQIHGTDIKIVFKKDKGKVLDNTDGLVTKEKNRYLAVLVADCLPIVAFDPKNEIIGIAHAGWRGTVAKIAESLVTKFKEMGSEPKDILIGFGPAIEFCHYEVGEEVGKKFKDVGLERAVLQNISGRIFVDLKQANVEQLLKSGIKKTNIDMSLKACTFENPDFYSFRRDRTSKRNAAIIGLKDGN